ncbi:cytochrome c [Pelagibacteraceae bacterium]|jgi:cytochrome c553|nr:cytochrome c [Pelagibacteraceae bacterium]|tara:strand:+ start:774 stop:1142 length:369 start_codon:yes stop_codon:yes gene_type:complete
MKKLIILIIFLFSPAVFAEELSKEMQNGKLKVQTVCVTCHGMNGQATGAGNSVIIPNITAQEKNYMIARLKAYKAGEIKHPQMSVVAQMLTEQDINDVAEWYSKIKIQILDPEGKGWKMFNK